MSAGQPPSVSGPELTGEPLERWEGQTREHWRVAWAVPMLCLYRRAGSTNDIAHALADTGAPAGTTVIADEQTAGRGRQGRQWHAPPGTALLMSVILRPASRPRPLIETLPLRVGVAVAGAIEGLTGVAPGLEWPNDVLIDGRKVAGILCEAAVTGSSPSFVVAGIGINVTLLTRDFPDGDVRERATSLLLATGRRVERAALAGALLRALWPLVAGGAGRLTGEIADRIASLDALRGRHVVDAAGRPLGVGDGIEPDGALRIRAADGGLLRLRTGSVRASPPAANHRAERGT